jgi:hypothetical protein
MWPGERCDEWPWAHCHDGTKPVQQLAIEDEV